MSGKTDIPVDSTFAYTFAQIVNTPTVTTGTFFIVPAPAPAAMVVKDAFDPTVCNAANAVAATVSCGSATECTLDPAADLLGGTLYAACLSTDIIYNSGTPFEGFMATFTTAGDIPGAFSAKLVRLDATELNFTDKPIPRAVKVKYTPVTPITVAADQAAFEAALALKDGAGTAVAGTYAWATDGSSVLFTPTARLNYRTTYTVYVDGAVVGLSFTTLTKNDINGDGFADLIVGAYTDRLTSLAGKLYIFYGTTTGIATCNISAGCAPGATLTGVAGDQLGLSNAFVGDVNGDGYEDFIVGAPRKLGTQKGTVYVFAGSTILTGTLTTTQALTTISDAAVGVDELGYSVAGAGDMNGDWYDDVVISAPAIEILSSNLGRAYIFLGGTALQGSLDVAVANQTITGQSGDFLGMMVDGAGDVNVDGFDDVIIGSDKNRVYVCYGAATLTTSRNAAAADAIVTAASGKFGNSVAGAGDVNADGIADVMVGDPGNAPNGSVYVFLGAQLVGAVDAATASTIISNPASDDLFGATLTSAGDVDNDGKSDLLIGGKIASPADLGVAYLFLGSGLAATMVNTDANAQIGGATGGDMLGLGLSGAVDFNNDGFDDIVVGAPHYFNTVPPPGSLNGHAYVFNGSATGIASCDLSVTPTCPSVTLTGATADGLGFMGTTRYPLP